MERNTKYLSLLTLVLFFSGLVLIWFSLRPQDQTLSSPTPISALAEENIPTNTAKIIVATRSAALGVEGDRVLVTKVVDGDTIELQSGEKVRLIGIDTPETKDPKRPIGCFGKEASNKAKNLLEGKEVILQKDISETDKYKRLLRYVFLPLEGGQMLFVQDYLVREGFGKVLTFPPDVKFNEQLREAEEYAKINKKGLWGKC